MSDNVRAAVRADMAEQMAVVRHNRRWLVRLHLIARRPMPEPLWPRTGVPVDSKAKETPNAD